MSIAPSPTSSTAAAAPAVFSLHGVTKQYDEGQVQALRGVDLEIRQGEFVAIVGPSGSGKSTLLQLLGALDQPSEGRILYGGRQLASASELSAYRATEIGFIFQAFHLLPTFTARENVEIPMFESSTPAGERRKLADELLQAVGLGHRLDHLPSKMSGGERQRVAVARSLANRPSILLADEPTGNLDTKNAQQIMELIVRVQKERAMTLVLVTHDPEIARTASRIIEVRDGRVVVDHAGEGRAV